jgi:hypothetical protein
VRAQPSYAQDLLPSAPTQATPALDVPGVPPPQVRRDADRHGADVHVFKVGRTVGHAPSAEATGKTVAPHVRRGHWRRQHYGEGNAHVRRIRIAPLPGNAHLGDMAERCTGCLLRPAR